MLSIIISSYQPEFYNALEKNISETCGIAYEIIKIDNPGTMSITAAYNKGVLKAQFPYLLFLHEDLIFHTKDWGRKLIAHLQNPKTGIVGIAGSSYIPTAPSGWHIPSDYHNHVHIIQNIKDKSNPAPLSTFKNGDVTKNAIAIDGVFMAINKANIPSPIFNENVKGFHGYDLDFSLQTAKKYQNYIVSDILLEHFSRGKPDQTLFENNIQIRAAHGNNFNVKNESDIERKAFIAFVEQHNLFKGISIQNLMRTLRFFPVGKIKLKDYFIIFRHYYNYLKFKKNYTEKYNYKKI